MFPPAFWVFEISDSSQLGQAELLSEPLFGGVFVEGE
jgi:hypothetical protein